MSTVHHIEHGADSAAEMNILHERLMYLNHLRVKSAQFYMVLIGAVFALSTVVRDGAKFIVVWRYAGLPLFLAGILVLMLDARLRGRAGATTDGIRGRVEGLKAVACSRGIGRVIEEDALFGLLICSVNAFVGIIFIAAWASSEAMAQSASSCQVVKMLAIFSALVALQRWLWGSRRQLWHKEYEDEWPL